MIRAIADLKSSRCLFFWSTYRHWYLFSLFEHRYHPVAARAVAKKTFSLSRQVETGCLACSHVVVFMGNFDISLCAVGHAVARATIECQFDQKLGKGPVDANIIRANKIKSVVYTVRYVML